MISPAIAAIALAVMAALAFGGGWMVQGWKTGKEIEQLKSRNTILSSGNAKCVADVRNVVSALKELERVTDQREEQAREAMQQVQPIVERRKATITRIRSLPAVAPNMQYEAIKQEQVAYVAMRQDESR